MKYLGTITDDKDLVTKEYVDDGLSGKAASSHTHVKNNITDFPTNVSSFANDAGYLTSFTETDPVFSASAAHGISSSDISNWNSKQSAISSTTATLAVNSWSSGTQTVNVTGVTSSNTVVVSPAPSSVSDYASAGIYCSAQGSGTLTFTCSTTPTSAITVNVMIVG